MFKYNVKIQKVSGRLNESVLPSKNLVVKSKSKKTDEQIFAEASKYFKNKYGLVIESAEVILEATGSEQYIVEIAKKLKGQHLWLYHMSKTGGEPLVQKIEAYSYHNTSGNPADGNISLMINGKTQGFSVQNCSLSQVADKTAIFVPIAPNGYYNGAILTAQHAKLAGVNVSDEEATGTPETKTGFYY
jgi:hypothetical protein